ncbi:hypothetical protein PQX77_014585 [Marasmius sp. AFHP31]|nr:hypothetical protein PQX77_014585 [Marasmius sp. AFHP31]
MMDPLPYNLTVSSWTASLLYYPPRDSDTKASDGWELFYPSVDPGPGQRQGRGADTHKSTKAEASVTFNWLGTAIYVYGTSRKESYKFSVDGQDVGQTFDVQQGGLLGSMTDMQYKEHDAKLEVVGGEGLAFQYADLTIGLGYPGNDSSGWEVEGGNLATITSPNGTTSNITRQMVTNRLNDGLRFNVTAASAFILWGSLYLTHPPKRATISPSPGSSDLTGTKETIIYNTGAYVDYQQVLYWESGLDRETSYTVEISQFVGKQLMSFNELQLLDGGSPPPSAPSTTDEAPSVTDEGHHRPHLAPANIAVIVSRCNIFTFARADKLGVAKVVAPILFLVAIGVGVLWYRRRRANLGRQTPLVTPYVGVSKDTAPLSKTSTSPRAPPPAPPQTSLSSSTPTSQPSREVDAGPLPPQYNPLWAAAPSGDQTVPAIRPAEPVQNDEIK